MNYRKQERFIHADFNASFDPKIEKVKKWLEEWETQKNNLLVCGSSGVGKTWIIMAFLNWLAEQAQLNESKFGNFYTSKDFDNIEYTTAKEFFDTIKLKFSAKSDTRENSENMIWKWERVKLLIIDEMGVQYDTKSEMIELTDIMDNRWRNCLPTIFITNLSMKGLGELLGERARQRIFDGAGYIEFDSKTQRNKPKEL